MVSAGAPENCLEGPHGAGRRCPDGVRGGDSSEVRSEPSAAHPAVRPLGKGQFSFLVIPSQKSGRETGNIGLDGVARCLGREPGGPGLPQAAARTPVRQRTGGIRQVASSVSYPHFRSRQLRTLDPRRRWEGAEKRGEVVTGRGAPPAQV